MVVCLAELASSEFSKPRPRKIAAEPPTAPTRQTPLQSDEVVRGNEVATRKFVTHVSDWWRGGARGDWWPAARSD